MVFFMLYVYRKKSLIREFTDGYIRDMLQTVWLKEGGNELKPLPRLCIKLGRLDLEIDFKEAVKILDIASEKSNFQRLLCWPIFKAFYDPNLSFDTMCHINFNWYDAKNTRLHTVEDVQSWCNQNKLTMERLKKEEARIACLVRKE